MSLGRVGYRKVPVGNEAGHIVELRLPATPEYLPVLRATAGVVAGNLSFNYDEILQRTSTT